MDLEEALVEMVERWEADAQVIEESTHNINGKAIPAVRRRFVAEAIRAAARDVRSLLDKSGVDNIPNAVPPSPQWPDVPAQEEK
jgi:hypothetical protein